MKPYYHYFVCADCSKEYDIGRKVIRKGKEVVVCKKCYLKAKNKGETNG